MTAESTASNEYVLLGASGLRVSRLALGTMTFGDDLGWGADESVSRQMFDIYADRGGNFIDTANAYTNGSSERMVGSFVRGRRDRFVIATKYSNGQAPGDPNSGGNGRKSMLQAIDASLKRLNTDYIDLYYLHLWDDLTPPDEILRAFDDLVTAGKILHVGVSNVPAWQIARMQTIAQLKDMAPLIAIQIEYSLIERTAERDLKPMATRFGIGNVVWSPLAGGILSGKYSAADAKMPKGKLTVSNVSRQQLNTARGAITERNLAIAGEVGRVASEVDASSAQVALAWLLAKPDVTSVLIGARTPEQLNDNLAADQVRLEPTHLAALDAASAIDLGYPHSFLALPYVQQVLNSGTNVRR